MDEAEIQKKIRTMLAQGIEQYANLCLDRNEKYE